MSDCQHLNLHFDHELLPALKDGELSNTFAVKVSCHCTKCGKVFHFLTHVSETVTGVSARAFMFVAPEGEKPAFGLYPMIAYASERWGEEITIPKPITIQ